MCTDFPYRIDFLAFFFFFFNDTATTEIYTLSLHDALPIHRALDVEHLEQRLDPPAPEVDLREYGRQRRSILAQSLQYPRHHLARRERLLDEEVLNALVLRPAQQDDVGVCDRPPSAAHL